MTPQQAADMAKGFGFISTPPLPPVNDLLKSIVAGLQSLGESGLSGAPLANVQAHLNGVDSAIKHALKQRIIVEKIATNNATQAELDKKKAEANKNVQTPLPDKGTLGNLA